MTNFTKLLKEIANRKFNMREGKDGDMEWSQTERNNLRRELVEALYLDCKDAGLECYQVDKGIAIDIYNEIEGVLNAVLNISMCGLDYDAESEAQDFALKQEKKEARKEKNKDKNKKGE